MIQFRVGFLSIADPVGIKGPVARRRRRRKKRERQWKKQREQTNKTEKRTSSNVGKHVNEREREREGTPRFQRQTTRLVYVC